MITWVLIKVFADIVGAGNAIFVKKILSRQAGHQLNLFCVALISTPFAAIGLFYLTTLILQHVLIALAVGVLYILTGHFFYLAMSTGQPSRISLITRMGSVFTLLLSTIVLKESLTPLQNFAFALSFFGGVILVTQRSERHFQIDRVTSYAITSMLIGTVSATLTLFLLQYYPLWETFTMTRAGVIVGTICLLGPKGIWNAQKAILNLRRQHSSSLVGEQLIRLITLFLDTTAVAAIGSAALVSVLSGFSPLYVWLIAIATRHETLRNGPFKVQVVALITLVISLYLMQR